MFLCQVVPVAALQLSALCRRKWCNSMSVWVWGTVTDDWSLCMVLVTDSDSQLWGAVHDSSLNVCDDRLLASRQSRLHFFSLIHYLHFSKCHHLISIPSPIFICCYLIPFPLMAHLFLYPLSSLHLHSLFLPLVSPLPFSISSFSLFSDDEVAVIAMREKHEDVSVQNMWWRLHWGGLEERLLTLSLM